MLTFKIFMAAVFVVTGGAVFTERFRKYGWLMILASVVSVIGAFYLFLDIKNDIMASIKDEVGVSSNVTAFDEACKSKIFSIARGGSRCGFKYFKDGRLEFLETSIAYMIMESGYNSNVKTPADEVTIYSSPTGGHFYLVATLKTSIVDRLQYSWSWNRKHKSRGIIYTIKTSGKYGHRQDWIKWSKKEDAFLLVTSVEGVMWFHAVSTNGGTVSEYPDQVDYPIKYPKEFLKYESYEFSLDTFQWLNEEQGVFAIDLIVHCDSREYKNDAEAFKDRFRCNNSGDLNKIKKLKFRLSYEGIARL